MLMQNFYSYKRKMSKRKVQFSQVQSVKDCLGELEQGYEMFCLNVGQFNLIDVVEYLIETAGDCDVTIATWTAADSNISRAFDFLKNGKVRSMRWILDPSFKSRKPDYVATLMRLFGQDCVRTIPTHAKFVTVTNEKWNFVLQTSMNLNQNKRLENFTLTEDSEFAKFFKNFTDDVFNKFSTEDLFGSQNPNQLNRVVKVEKKLAAKQFDPNFVL